jgi:hypothetical protein
MMERSGNKYLLENLRRRSFLEISAYMGGKYELW